MLITLTPMSAAVRTAMASVSTLPTPNGHPSRGTYLRLDCRILITETPGAIPANGGSASGSGVAAMIPTTGVLGF
jgi:hypothetical protein